MVSRANFSKYASLGMVTCSEVLISNTSVRRIPTSRSKVFGGSRRSSSLEAVSVILYTLSQAYGVSYTSFTSCPDSRLDNPIHLYTSFPN
jgi:hypothetical protein